jgi:hypothetical protein
MHAGNLIPGPLPFVEPGLWLRQAHWQEPRHRLFYSDDLPFSGGLNALPQPLCHVVVGLDPGFLKCRAEALDVVLRLCRMAAESAGR